MDKHKFRRKRVIKSPGKRVVDGIIILKYTQISSKIVGLVQDWITCGYQVDTVVGLRGPQKTENAAPAQPRMPYQHQLASQERWCSKNMPF
jgi:hypothetical protein